MAFYNFDLKTNQGRGYAIVCADRRLPQVIAYSTKGSMEEINNSENRFFIDYVQNLPLAITQLIAARNGHPTLENDYIEGFSWEPRIGDAHHVWLTDSTMEGLGYLEESAIWDQEYPYNNDMPFNPLENKRFPVGCSNIACVNIMTYYAYSAPQTYMLETFRRYRNIIAGNGNADDDDPSIVANAGKLCKDIAIANKSTFDTLTNMTGTNPYNVVKGLESFGYISNPVMDYNIDSISLSLSRGHLIYMRGEDSTKEKSGHAFVVRGIWGVIPFNAYMETIYMTISLGINWGASGGFGDGFYLAELDGENMLDIIGLHQRILTNFGIGSINRGDRLKIITNIRPNR